MTVAATESGIICTFNDVMPVNTVEEGIKTGHYTDYYHFITNQTVLLKPAKGAKKLHLVGFNRTIGETEWESLLKAEGKQPCQNAPNYLLGLMAKLPEDKFPQELRNKNIVAAEGSSVFTGKFSYRCFLCVIRFGRRRGLDLARVAGGWRGRRVFLAEDLVS